MGEKPRNYEALSDRVTLVDIDWNTDQYAPKINKEGILIGFSMGCYYPLTHALKHRVKNLILCSVPPLETLANVKADRVIFLVGSKERFVLQNVRRVAKTFKSEKQIIVISGADHQISGNYRKKLLEVIGQL